MPAPDLGALIPDWLIKAAPPDRPGWDIQRDCAVYTVTHVLGEDEARARFSYAASESLRAPYLVHAVLRRHGVPVAYGRLVHGSGWTVDTAAPSRGHCDPACLGWFPSSGEHGLRIERCDECASASGLASLYHDGHAERDAAIWLVQTLRAAPSDPPSLPDAPEVSSIRAPMVMRALWNHASGRMAIAWAFR